MNMHTRGVMSGVALLSLSAFLSTASNVEAQTLSAAAKQRLQEYVTSVNRIPAAQQKMLSGGALSFYQFAITQTTDQTNQAQHDGIINPRSNSAVANSRQLTSRQVSSPIPAIVLNPGVVHVNDPSRDFKLSQVAGFTQSETSTARCGNTVVVGFNDSGALLRTLTNPNSGLSFDGVAFSSDGGSSFTELNYLNPGTKTSNFLLGDPVVACSSPTLFYYSSIFQTTRQPANPMGSPYPVTAVSLSGSPGESLPGAPPRIAVAKDGLFHFLDKDWMTLDPTTPSTIYITYTDFDSSFSGVCGADFRYAIEIVKSTDSGSHWTSPTTVVEQCGGASGSEVYFASGSQVAVDKNHKVYVAYEAFLADGTREIHDQYSTDGGATFSSPVVVGALTPTGDGHLLKGGFRSNEYPSLAIDPTNNDPYLVWADATGNTVSDLASPSGFYGYGNIVGTASMDGGNTWDPADPAHAVAKDDQFMPGIAVDKTGKIAVCYYDRRNDSTDVRIDRYCTTSTNTGGTFADLKVTARSFIPVHNADSYIAIDYMGDYDTVAADTLGVNPGFVGAFQIIQGINPNVYAVKF